MTISFKTAMDKEIAALNALKLQVQNQISKNQNKKPAVPTFTLYAWYQSRFK